MDKKQPELKRGWTTGACAAAAAKAACAALLRGDFPDPVTITLPGGQTPAFALARYELSGSFARAAIVKDAGDDPDVTHGALIEVCLRRAPPGTGLDFRAGSGVGMVTLPGLPIPPGEPAINPKPRAMIARAIADISPDNADFIVEISVPDGEKMARQTLNLRLGIVGGISILGTSGIVIPFSCAAWISSIHRGIDVARAIGHTHVAASTGDTSEKAVQARYDLDERQLIDMGDFVGGTLKYIKTHPVASVTIAGGVAKMAKLAQGLLDLHSKRGRADMAALAQIALSGAVAGSPPSPPALSPPSPPALSPPVSPAPSLTQEQWRQLDDAIRRSNTVAEAFDHARRQNVPLGDWVAAKAWQVAARVLGDNEIELEIILFDHKGVCRGRAPMRAVRRRGDM